MKLVRVGCALILAVTFQGRAQSAAAPGALDTLVLGEAVSEQNHGLTQANSEVIHGGLGESARRLLPLNPVSYDGGSISFALKVDPQAQNYLTVKLWGSDKGAARGRLILYIDGLQVGYRHEGDQDVLNQTDEEAIFQGRFLYQTVTLPLMRTQGKSEVNLKIAGLGPMWTYGANFTQKQHDLTEPTRGIYRLYTHTNTEFVPDASEKQGTFVTPAVRPGGPGEELLTQMKATVNSRLDQIMAGRTNGPGGNPEGTLLLLAEAYNTSWTTAYHNEQAIAALVRVGDAIVRSGNFGVDNWVGAGPLGEAIARVGSNPLLAKALEEQMDAPAQRVKSTRREAWARALRGSLDEHRLHGRRFYSNQSLIVDRNIYTANRGLILIDPSQALPEKQALRYVYEAMGLLPWLGNDTSTGGEKQYGTNYFQVTRKGLTRELGYVGTYGETILKFSRDLAELTGDEKIRQQLVKLESARMNFRYPSQDPDGYRVMKLVSEIDARTAHFPAPNGAYAGADVRELWWMEVPAFTKDPVSVGAAQQLLEDNQYFYRLAQRSRDVDTLGMMRNIGEYAAVKALPKSSFRMPMTEGQPDFVFADEQNAVVAIKHARERLFLNFYFRQEFGVSGAVRLLDVTPTIMRIATVKSQFEVEYSGQEWTRPDVIDFERSGGFPPPGKQIHQAWQGEKLPIAKRPEGAREPRYGTWGPFVGKAAFYSLRYGDYLIAINTTADKTFELNPPPNETEAEELVSGKRIKLAGPMKVGPLSTVVLWLGKNGG